jgi:2',3'-cyclic-nucleotide 2'-phosphodiesterase (5'-nucleotidase family)
MTKQIIWRCSFILGLVMTVFACQTESDGAAVIVPQEIIKPFPHKTIGESCDSSLATQSVKIIHLSDLHGRFGLGKRKYEKLYQFYRDALSQQQYTLFTNAGDDYEKGSVSEPLSVGASVREAVFAMEFDARTLGNHDFAWGIDELKKFTQDPKAVVFAANTKYIGDITNELSFDDYAEFTLGCIKIGIFGMVSEPWNEMDEQYKGDFLPEVKNDWRLAKIAEDIVRKYRDNVDVLIMLSHLGEGADIEIATSVNGIDLVLGGHSHGGVTYNEVNNTVVIQPEFYADGLSEINLQYNVNEKRIEQVNHTSHLTKDMTEFNQNLAVQLDKIITRYGATANHEIGYSEYSYGLSDKRNIAQITANAITELSLADAALLSETLVWIPWDSGALTQQILNNAYRIERQESNTPGVNAIYTVQVTGEMLAAMTDDQSDWLNSMPNAVNPNQLYTLALHKGAALNPALFFNSKIELLNTKFLSETWQVLERYSNQQTEKCQFVDSQNLLFECRDSSFSLWSFSDVISPLVADLGSGVISYRDLESNGFLPRQTLFGLTSDFGINPLSDGIARVMKFAQTEPDEGYRVSHGLPTNGDFQTKNKVFNYTLLMDLYWPAETSGWGPLLQTSLDNNDDADLFSHRQLEQGLGLSSYFGSLVANKWYRIAFVVNAATQGGTIDIYIDGVLKGQLDDVNERWALDDVFYVFTDDDGQTRAGYINLLLIVDKPLTTTDLATLGPASISLDTSILINSDNR